MTKRVAVLVDGDNLSPTYATEIHRIGQNAGRVDIARVYTDAQRNSLWHDATRFHLIHSGTGKNATDLLLAIDAVELALRQVCETVVIASSDGDFVHVHRRLREHGIETIGVGESKTPAIIQKSCSKFIELAPRGDPSPDSSVSEMDCKIRKIIAANSKNGAGMRLTILGAKMHRQHGIKIRERPEKTWRQYLHLKPDLYDLDPAGQNAHVRFKPEGFA